VAVAVSLAVVLLCTYKPLNPFAAIAAVKALTDGTTDVGTFAITFFDVLATREVPLYVCNATVIVPLVLLGNHECGIV
jgi:hypothetical protein